MNDENYDENNLLSIGKISSSVKFFHLIKMFIFLFDVCIIEKKLLHIDTHSRIENKRDMRYKISAEKEEEG